MDVMSEQGEKRAKFVRFAEKRTQVALSSIRKIGNLSNRRAYEWSPSDVNKIVNALRDAIADMEGKFDPKNSEKHPKFQL